LPKKKQRHEGLPPASDSLALRIKWANYQTLGWKQALRAKQNLPDPIRNGWEISDDEQAIIQPKMMDNDPAPKGLVELVVCQCTKTAWHRL